MVDAAATPIAVAPRRAGQGARAWRFLRRNPTMVVGLVILSVMTAPVSIGVAILKYRL